MGKIIRYNKDLYYYHRPFVSFNAATAKDNLKREFKAGRSDTNTGFKIDGEYVDQKILQIPALSEKEEEAIVEESVVRCTQDHELQKWMRYNAHMNGPLGICWSNIVVRLQKFDIINFIEDNERALFHAFSPADEPDAVYFKAIIPCKAFLKYAPDDTNGTKILTISLAPEQPVVLFEATIKGKKTNNGIVTTLVEERLESFEEELEAYFAQIEKEIIIAHKLDVFIGDVQAQINNFVSTLPRTGGLAVKIKGGEGNSVIKAINQYLAIHKNKQYIEEENLNHQQIGKEFLMLLFQKRDEFLPMPQTDSGKRLRQVLDRLITDWSYDEDFHCEMGRNVMQAAAATTTSSIQTLLPSWMQSIWSATATNAAAACSVTVPNDILLDELFRMHWENENLQLQLSGCDEMIEQLVGNTKAQAKYILLKQELASQMDKCKKKIDEITIAYVEKQEMLVAARNQHC